MKEDAEGSSGHNHNDMIRLPLKYKSIIVGSAFVDDDLEPLDDTTTISLIIPRKLYQTSHHRSDVILALLQEDRSLLPRCHPFISLQGIQIRLAHIALKPEMVPLIDRCTPETLSTINRLRSNIARLSFANGDRTDCRRENIRELTGVPA